MPAMARGATGCAAVPSSEMAAVTIPSMRGLCAQRSAANAQAVLESSSALNCVKRPMAVEATASTRA
eukprot:5779295-Pyramimonas_sp.AAC.1